MSISKQLEQQLATAGAGPVSLAAQEGDSSVLCELVAVESLGVSLRLLELKSRQLEGKPAEQLRDVAGKLAKKVSYLLEAIAPVEIDDESCTIQMRSMPPHRAENATSYYEVLVTAGAISLRRYSKTRRTTRQVEAFDLTRQVLLRLVDDFATAAAEA
ncbi:hypothetical protein NG895_19070 [Aeoliella sp. ICT_H6.2]|uniref:Uncharacterized protein n=1 Tax=Aeoliella straminimaris TaxID=2954799 RepID=A0A9X2FIH7_9BACT|nr:hypothetical protein [Aeoliella straminimaris]MCO6046006.1 hypothetical protein [Aeoliella straminimaris]